jgi:hypothetical protein
MMMMATMTMLTEVRVRLDGWFASGARAASESTASFF